MKFCIDYCGVACVSHCPIAYEDELTSMGCDKPTCKECSYYQGCKDCFRGGNCDKEIQLGGDTNE